MNKDAYDKAQLLDHIMPGGLQTNPERFKKTSSTVLCSTSNNSETTNQACTCCCIETDLERVVLSSSQCNHVFEQGHKEVALQCPLMHLQSIPHFEQAVLYESKQ